MLRLGEDLAAASGDRLFTSDDSNSDLDGTEEDEDVVRCNGKLFPKARSKKARKAIMDTLQLNRDIFKGSLSEYDGRINSVENTMTSLLASLSPTARVERELLDGTIKRITGVEARMDLFSELSAVQWDRSTKLCQTLDSLGEQLLAKVKSVEAGQEEQKTEMNQRFGSVEIRADGAWELLRSERERVTKIGQSIEEIQEKTAFLETSLSQLIFVPQQAVSPSAVQQPPRSRSPGPAAPGVLESPPQAESPLSATRGSPWNWPSRDLPMLGSGVLRQVERRGEPQELSKRGSGEFCDGHRVDSSRQFGGSARVSPHRRVAQSLLRTSSPPQQRYSLNCGRAATCVKRSATSCTHPNTARRTEAEMPKFVQ